MGNAARTKAPAREPSRTRRREQQLALDLCFESERRIDAPFDDPIPF
jgi:hypothetical protein